MLVTCFSMLCSTLGAQVLQPLGNGLPGKVVASYASGNEYLALFDETSSPDTTDYTLGRWNGAYWSYYPGLTKPPTIPLGGTYNFHSVVLYQDTIYVGAYISNTSNDATVDVSHLHKWNGKQWVVENGVITSRNSGIVAMTVFDDKLIVAGRFRNTVNGNIVQNIASYDGKTRTWNYLGNQNDSQGTDGVINSLLVMGNRLYIAGDFKNFAGEFTGNIAYYTAANGGWGGTGSPFAGEVLSLASFNGYLAALGKNTLDETEIRYRDVNWSAPIGFDTFTTANVHSLAGADNYLLLGGDFLKNGNATSLLKYDNSALRWTGNRISGKFRLGQRGDGAFIWGSFTETNTGIRYISRIEPQSGEVAGTLFFDKDQNCSKASDEPGLIMAALRFSDEQGKVHFAITDSLGRFAIALPEGNYSITAFTGRHWINPCASNYAVKVRKGMYSFVSLGQYIAPGINDLQVQLASVLPGKVEPGQVVKIVITIKNLGSNAVNGATLHLKHDSRLTDFVSNPVPDNYTGNEATYSVVNLGMRETRTLELLLTVPLNATSAEKFFCDLKCGSGFTGGDAFKADNFDTTALSLKSGGTQGAVEKYSLKGGEVDYRTPDLPYHVDFTNTGSEFVKRVVMLDTIDSNLPIQDLPVLAYYPSQAKLSIVNQSVLVIEFPSANLSTLESSPQNASGFVKYAANLFKPLGKNDVIYNRATADFDSKWKASSERVVVRTYDPFAGISKLHASFGKLYPNPASGTLNIDFDKPQQGVLQIYSLQGKQLYFANVSGNTATIDVRNFPVGAVIVHCPSGSAILQINR
ncbi:MAG: T9SS type A sorting domain-containing protein [Bacteroidetes bacterium]|nr:T9SS type A sorting domain-containing protein [Bacteroidota bacterium]